MNRQTRIANALAQALHPQHLEVEDESHMHAVPVGAESHFKVVVVSEQFGSHGLVARHRVVNRLLQGEFDHGLHALALHTWTPDEWREKGGAAPASPPCRGGSKTR
ncbi:BolA/IbaG family iron-sulfur metabolism protein [uncultured Thiodictyon sp.]|uniref:BolA family protein n=1 Tax=uncultured Thiodictyon sp. TaxID=1846217 RepID=UPI0025FEA7EC|nr:BolA/IbaG family iron-sulfur metabolism protein [uncultured Thiodictyon sp.]